MKKILFFALVAMLFGCKSSDEPKVFKLDPLATFSIKPASGAWKVNGKYAKSSDSVHLSALDIVKQTTVLQIYYNNPILNQGLIKGERGFDVRQRDTISTTPCLKMWATDIISIDGDLVPNFIESKDCILIHFHEMTPTTKLDTIGYIPNSVIRAAEAAIKTAYADKNVELVYSIFNSAFTFYPITGSEYKALKAQNLQ